MRIVMTGATSGIGLEAARRLLGEGVSLVVGARTPDRLPGALAGKVEALALDLASLADVRRFASEVAAGGPIDALVLNAGLQNVTDAKSADGFEMSFAVNHLAHYLMIRLLLDRMASGARIILTSSGTHDPEEKTGIEPPRHIDPAKLAWPHQDPDLDRRRVARGRRAYSTSKLANLMTARELAVRTGKSRPDLTILAFDPGFAPGTGLARDYPPPLSLIFRFLLPLLVRRTDRVSTPQNSGRLLAALTTQPRFAGLRGRYLAVRRDDVLDVPPSALARDADQAARLWDNSAGLVGL